MKQRAMTVLLSLLATALILSGCSLFERLDPSTSMEPADGRVELPDAGIAVTLPDGWLLERRAAPLAEGVAGTLEQDQLGLLVPLVEAVPPTMHDRCVISDIAPLVVAQPGWLELDAVVAGFERLLADDPRWVGLKTEVLELPAGRTGRISRTLDGEATSVTTYVFTHADAWFILECVSQAVPPPDWRKVAATVDLFPAPQVEAQPVALQYTGPDRVAWPGWSEPALPATAVAIADEVV